MLWKHCKLLAFGSKLPRDIFNNVNHVTFAPIVRENYVRCRPIVMPVERNKWKWSKWLFWTKIRVSYPIIQGKFYYTFFLVFFTSMKKKMKLVIGADLLKVSPIWRHNHQAGPTKINLSSMITLLQTKPLGICGKPSAKFRRSIGGEKE